MKTYNVILLHESEQIYAKTDEEMSHWDENLGYNMLRSDNKDEINGKISELHLQYPKYKCKILA
jgi:hypothetical protein